MLEFPPIMLVGYPTGLQSVHLENLLTIISPSLGNDRYFMVHAATPASTSIALRKN